MLSEEGKKETSHLRDTRQQNAGKLNFTLTRHLQCPQHRNGNAKEQKIAEKGHRRVDTVNQTPLQAGVARSNRLPSVRPVSRHRFTVEDEQEDLGEEAGNQDAKDNLDGDQEVVVKPAHSVVECQTGYTAEQEGRRIEDMRDEIQHLRLKHRRDIQHVFYIGKMPAGAQVDELNT